MFLQYLLIMIVSCLLPGTEPCITDATSSHCYEIFDTGITWKNASDLCKYDGGTLAIIESVEEQTFIKDLMQKRTFDASGLWIGSGKLHPEEQRAWANGENFSYVNWAPGEPDNPQIDENCIEIYTNDSTWNDVKCTKRNGYICEKNSRADMKYIQDNNTGRWYKLVDKLITWDEAFNICNKDGGTLMIIESPEEQTFIADQILSTIFSARQLWLGSNNVHPEKTRKWSNGRTFTYVNWAKGEPNNYPYVENCAEMNTLDGRWNDRECTLRSGYICEKTRWTEPCLEDKTSGHCYQIFETKITWKNASDLCKHDGGNLVTIESVEEQKFIEELNAIVQHNIGYTWKPKVMVQEEQEKTSERTTDQQEPSGEPNNPPTDENCLDIYTSDTKWDDDECTERNGYICENSRAVGNYIQDTNSGRWYRLVDKLITWDDAFNICDKDGGTLMIIETAKEQAFIAGEPNNAPYVENCAEIYTNDRMWKDGACTFLRGYICEKTRLTEPCIEDKTSGHCYQIFDTKIAWKNVSDLCNHDAGNLVTIESVEEQKFIEDLVQNRTLNAEGLWIGSDKLHPEDQRAWANGEKFSYVNWAKGEPSSSLIDENCVEIYTNDSTWNDEKCTERNGYICENSRAVRNYIQDNNKGRWYKLVDELIKWDDAFNNCDKDGGMLMIIESPEEQTFIADQIRDTKLEAKGLWIGSNMVHPVRKRTWTNGQKFTYVNWAKGEPNNSPYFENCAEMYTSNFMWNDRDCTLLRGYICEKPPEVTPYKLQEIFIIIASVGSALVIFVGVTILCCLLHKRNKCKKKKNEDYQDVQNIEMNQAEHGYNRDNVLSGTYCSIDDN